MQTMNFDRIRVGDELPPFERTIDTSQLVRYAAASGDFEPQHWDHLYMVAHGFPGVIVHGWFTFAVACEAAARWIPPEVAEVREFSVRYHRVQLPGPVRCGGRVAAVGSGTDRTAELALWVRGADDVDTMTAIVRLSFS